MTNLKLWPVLLLLVTLAGCFGGSVATVTEAPPPPPPPPAAGTSDQILLEETLRGRALGNEEVVELSDRLLEANAALNDQTTMARLEILLLKALKTQDKAHRPAILRNLGIIHYHQGKYKKARQELQHANELNPRDPRTHFYLARLFTHQGEIYQKQGKNKLSKQQFKRASIEMEMARKLAPNNSTYRQDLEQIIKKEQVK